MEVSSSTPNPSAPASTSPTPEEVAAQEPMFASFHTLLKRVTSKSELPSGTLWIRDENRVLQEIARKDIPADRSGPLHSAIAEGRVYCLWGHRFLQFDELEGDWHLLGKRTPDTDTDTAPDPVDLTTTFPPKADGSERPSGSVPSVADVFVKLNYQGTLVHLVANTPAELLAFADQRAIAETHVLRAKAYEAAVVEVKRQWPELRAPEHKPVAPEATQGTLL